MLKALVLVVFFVPLLAVTFQNCSNKSYSVDENGVFVDNCLKDSTFSENCLNRTKDSYSKNLSNAPTDILFVLDDSCSMQTIANAVRDGFNSLVASKFPPNTKMAVTYMSPSKVMINSSGAEEIDFLSAYPGLQTHIQNTIKILPGHMDLVTKNNINEFKALRATMPNRTDAFVYNIPVSVFDSLYPGVNYAAGNTNGLTYLATNPNRPEALIQLKYDPNQSLNNRTYNSSPNALVGEKAYQLASFPKVGCNNGWFDPKETASDGQSCLSAAIQLTPVCTGVEAGLVSLEQLLKLYSSRGQKLFRDNAIVNIIFVSDTHESGWYVPEGEPNPGERYFATAGAPARMKTLAEIQSVIQQNNSTVQAIKFSGIVPLPEMGNSLLNGLTTIGKIPATQQETVINGEGTNSFHYLPLIKGSKGLAAHAANNNWSSIADQIVADAKFAGNVLVVLKKKAAKIHKIWVNGVEYDVQKVILNADKQSFTIQLENTSAATVKIDVDYQIL